MDKQFLAAMFVPCAGAALGMWLGSLTDYPAMVGLGCLLGFAFTVASCGKWLPRSGD